MINYTLSLSATFETVLCKLLLVPQQRHHLEVTLQAFADACNYIWLYGKKHQISQQWKLHQACYQHIRKKFALPANLTIRAIARLAPLLKTENNKCYPFTPNLIAALFYSIKMTGLSELLYWMEEKDFIWTWEITRNGS